MAEVNDDADAAAPDEIEGYEPPVAGGWYDYPLDELAIRDERRTAEDVVRRIEKGRFVLDPDFQRDFVWDESKQSRLVESVLVRIPLPVFYVAEDAQGRLIVVDGRQRLTTLQRFLGGQLRLSLPDRPELHQRRFEDLDVRLQNRVEDCQLLFYIIDHAVPERARLDIFERVNGGEVLARQEMRNAIYQGPATVLVRDEAASELFVAATGGSLKPRRMRDREFVNRFCSFTSMPLAEYRGDMDVWLANGLVLMNGADETRLQALRDGLRRGLRNNLTVFGAHAFRKHRDPEQSRSVINAALYDVMVTGLATREESVVAARAEPLRAAFYGLMDDAAFVKAITDGPNTAVEVRTRFAMAGAMFAEVLDAA
jgi:hypothetical protein